MATAEQLLSEGRIDKVKSRAKFSESSLSRAGSDLKAAKDNVPLGNSEWAIKMCQSCAFNAASSLMARFGYSPTHDADLETVYEFFETADSDIAKQLSPLLSSPKSPKAAIDTAEKFLKSIGQ